MSGPSSIYIDRRGEVSAAGFAPFSGKETSFFARNFKKL